MTLRYQKKKLYEGKRSSEPNSSRNIRKNLKREAHAVF